MSFPMPEQTVLERLRHGTVIPAIPLALDGARHFDWRHQRALVRYYAAAGAGGIAVGVHTTQFEIRDPGVGLFEPVLRLCAEAAAEAERVSGERLVRIAGACGDTAQACREAQLAGDCGYDAILLSLAGVPGNTPDQLVAHCRAVAGVAPIMGFYLQPAVGGRVLPYEFWREFAEIDNVVAIKIAAFNRYRTLDVVRAVIDSGRADEIALYTGNDDNIVADLVTPLRLGEFQDAPVFMRGGLLGQFSVWTRTAVKLLHEIHETLARGEGIPPALLERGAQLTDANAAVFDTAHEFRGCIPGINEVLRRQGLLATRYCVDPRLDLSEGQAGEIDRVCGRYTWLPDDGFVRAHLAEWLD
jgi:dihydrodipicolinate synthase/N-acetylneuraminate lyase